MSDWYNLQADLDFPLPGDIAPAGDARRRLRVSIPPSLLRQERGRERWHPIPPEVADAYAAWRPTPLRRAATFERAIGTRSRIWFKYEGGNVSGSHKFNTAVAQAHYYAGAGVTELVVGTGAGQWGTAVAAACARLGLRCTVFMVRSSRRSKPYRGALMRLLGTDVVESPSDRTPVGRKALAEDPEHGGTLSIALGEAQEFAQEYGGSFCTGSGEGYSLLHQTVIGLESLAQLRELGVAPDVVTACVGGGSNFGGLTFPFLGAGLRGELEVTPRLVAAESTACPTLTRGRYAYDFTDASRGTALQKMYTLGADYAVPPMHAGGLRYHGSAKLISALLDRGAIEARAHRQRDVFESAALFLRTEGILPAPESAHALHSARREALELDRAGGGTVLTCVSGHGLLDLAGYEGYLNGDLADVDVDDEIARSLALLPEVPTPSGRAR
ncbi:MAG: TrpB-like pyridoxal-phosphate dependent enzyme [Actinobacteria bacterium 13_2_20CM_2_71_6]|nr:MAG: TrpB-like pyridoxal-phosphate dependent enzyme [Actinobacteria bacterium 13_2_20CM_2_71_6]